MTPCFSAIRARLVSSRLVVLSLSAVCLLGGCLVPADTTEEADTKEEDEWTPSGPRGDREEEGFDKGARRRFVWTDWTEATPGVNGSATGVLELADGPVEVTYKGELRGAQVTPASVNHWESKETYVSETVKEPPSSTDALLINGAADVEYELTFSRPVKDPIIAIASLGAPRIPATYRFEAPFLLLSQGTGYYGSDGPLEKLPDNTLRGAESNGVIGFEGEFTTIRWTTPQFEPWHALTVAASSEAPAQ